MKQIHFYIIIWGSLYFFGCGTTNLTSIENKDSNVIDTANFECTYQLKYLTDSIKMEYSNDLYVIQIGENFTKSFCYQPNYLHIFRYHHRQQATSAAVVPLSIKQTILLQIT